MKTTQNPTIISFLNLIKCLELAQEEGFCMRVKQHAQRVFTCDIPVQRHPKTGLWVPCFSWKDLARYCAEYLPGQCRVLSSGGFCWINGADGPHGVCVPTANYQQWEEARKLAYGAFGYGLRAEKIATIGSIARLFLSYASDPQEYKPDAEWLFRDTTFGYHDCIPGEYHDATQWDVSGYYFHILRELKTLRFRVRRNGLSQLPMRTDEWDSWQDVLYRVKDCKILRNSLVGVMCGSLEKGVAFTRNGCRNGERVREIHPPGKPGPFRACGNLVVRIGAETCRAESLHSGSKYSTIDCVTLVDGREPTIWPMLGFEVSPRYSGNADIRGRGCYRIGTRSTKPYDLMMKVNPGFTNPVAPAKVPFHCYAVHVLNPKGGFNFNAL